MFFLIKLISRFLEGIMLRFSVLTFCLSLVFSSFSYAGITKYFFSDEENSPQSQLLSRQEFIKNFQNFGEPDNNVNRIVTLNNKYLYVASPENNTIRRVGLKSFKSRTYALPEELGQVTRIWGTHDPRTLFVMSYDNNCKNFILLNLTETSVQWKELEKVYNLNLAEQICHPVIFSQEDLKNLPQGHFYYTLAESFETAYQVDQYKHSSLQLKEYQPDWGVYQGNPTVLQTFPGLYGAAFAHYKGSKVDPYAFLSYMGQDPFVRFFVNGKLTAYEAPDVTYPNGDLLPLVRFSLPSYLFKFEQTHFKLTDKTIPICSKLGTPKQISLLTKEQIDSLPSDVVDFIPSYSLAPKIDAYATYWSRIGWQPSRDEEEPKALASFLNRVQEKSGKDLAFLDQNQAALLFTSRSPYGRDDLLLVRRDPLKSKWISIFKDKDELKHLRELLPSVQPFEFTTSDGTPLQGYRTTPNLPLSNNATIILIHGGPADTRDSWGLTSYEDSLRLFLSSRGYYVMQINFRGSKGFGEAFENIGLSKGYQFALNDLNEFISYLQKNSKLNPSETAIMGVSFGAHAVAHFIANSEIPYAAAIAVSGDYDHENTFKKFQSGDDWLKTAQDFTLWPENPEHLETLRQRSPIHQADRIQTPLLLIHGTEDPICDVSQARNFAKVLKKSNKDISYLELKGEGHGFGEPNNVNSILWLFEHFLAKHLGGREESRIEDGKRDILKASKDIKFKEGKKNFK